MSVEYSTVQYSLVQYRVTHETHEQLQFLFNIWSLIANSNRKMREKHFYTHEKWDVMWRINPFHISPRNNVIYWRGREWLIPHPALSAAGAGDIIRLFHLAFMWPITPPPSCSPPPRVPISWQLGGTAPSKLQGLLSLNITPSCCPACCCAQV